MQILTIETASFRNLESGKTTCGPRFNILAGANAQGKTNFLEALYLVACLRSFRARRSAELPRFGQEQALVRASLERDGIHREMEVRIHPRGRKALVDGKGVRSTARYLEGGLNVVLFTPDDVQIPRGSPSERRRLLDRAITNLWPAYLPLSREYHKTLQSRNRVLKESNQTTAGTLSRLLEVYDQQLSERGARLLAARLRFVRGLAPCFSEVFDDISRSGVTASLHYQCTEELLEHSDTDLPGLARTLRNQLTHAVRIDRARQLTTCGPHTDDLEFRLDDRSTQKVGSQGQLRSVMLAFKVSQILDAFEKQGDYPVLLLDDVSSELDADRARYVFDFIGEISCQAFLTTTRPQLVTIVDNRLDFQVVSGRIVPQN